jgi:hypothetical protein
MGNPRGARMTDSFGVLAAKPLASEGLVGIFGPVRTALDRTLLGNPVT